MPHSSHTPRWDSSVQDAFQNYASALSASWRHPAFVAPSPLGPSTLKQVVTRADGDRPTTLPLTGRLVRGAHGVVVASVEPPPTPASRPSAYALLLAAAPTSSSSPPVSEAQTGVAESVRLAKDQLLGLLATFPALLERTYDISGFKNYDQAAVRRLIDADSNASDPTPVEMLRRTTGLDWALARYLSRALDASDFDPEDPGTFDDWMPVVDQTIDMLRTLEERLVWTYDVVALLNAPAIDSETPLSLCRTTVDGQPVEVTIEAATDALLNDLLYRNYNFTGVGAGVATAPVNAALRYQIQVPVDAPMDAYVEVLSAGGNLFTHVVDVLRLLRSDDVGIVGVESLPAEPNAPTIRYHYDVGHNPTYASVIPRRSYFFLESAEPLSDAHLAGAQMMLPPYIGHTHGVQGLNVAMRRYRDSRERHRPDDPESLLDLTVALEAVLLSEGAHSELSYRLGIRAAQLLGQTVEERVDLFDGLRDLYGIRSKLAHGEAMDSMKLKDAAKVAQALQTAPEILKEILIRFLCGDGPSGLTGTALAAWWRRVELGGAAPAP